MSAASVVAFGWAVAFRGAATMPTVSAQKAGVHVAVAVWPWPSYFDPAEKLKGIRLDISQWKRPAPDTAPTQAKAAGLYMICTMSKHAAEAKGYADALMFDYRGLVAEATGANIFFVKDGRLHTPIPDCFLDGITRQTAIALAKRRGIEVIERRIMPEELTGFSECFITGSAAEVTAVSEIADWRFTPGAIPPPLHRRLYIVQRSVFAHGLSPSDIPVAVHELVHALQDAHFGIPHVLLGLDDIALEQNDAAERELARERPQFDRDRRAGEAGHEQLADG